MFKVSVKLFAFVVLLFIAMVACSSGSDSDGSVQQETPAEESSQSEKSKSDSKPDDNKEVATEPSSGVSDDDKPATQSGSDSAIAEEVEEPESGEDLAESEPEREPDVIPFASDDEQSRMVSLQINEQYGAGTMVSSGELGIAFTIPTDWIGIIPEGSPFFFMSSEIRPGLVIVTSQDSNSVDEILGILSQSMPIDEGVMLEPKEQPKADGPWVEVGVTASDGVDVFNGYVMALVRKSGVGIFIAVIGPDDSSYYQEVASDIASSSRAIITIVASDQSSSAPVASASDSSALVKEWTDFFAGMRATYISTYSSGLSGGFSNRIEYDFCSNGQFDYNGSSSMSIDTGGASAFSGGPSGGAGTWKIVTQGENVFLELNWNDGSFGQPRLEYIDEQTFFDGDRYFITPDNTVCE